MTGGLRHSSSGKSKHSPTAGGVSFEMDSADLRKLFLDLKAMDGNLQIQLRRAIKKCGVDVADRVKSNAQFSTRIPGAVKVKPYFQARKSGVFIEVDKKGAPHARAIEHEGTVGTFRAPLFGNKNHWYTHTSRPFFFTAAAAMKTQVEAEIRAVLDKVAKDAGFTN